jgi:hypothetical protein
MVIFNLNVVFTKNVLKMGLIRVRFTPGFPPGAGLARIGATFKEFVVKTAFQLNINIKRNPLNFKSIQ